MKEKLAFFKEFKEFCENFEDFDDEAPILEDGNIRIFKEGATPKSDFIYRDTGNIMPILSVSAADVAAVSDFVSAKISRGLEKIQNKEEIQSWAIWHDIIYMSEKPEITTYLKLFTHHAELSNVKQQVICDKITEIGKKIIKELRGFGCETNIELTIKKA